MLKRISISILLLLVGCDRQEPPPAGLRLVSTAPHLTEALCAIGAGNLLVGRTDACDYPPEALTRVPAVGGFGTPWLEPLLHCRPTHVVETILASPEIASRLEAAGIAFVHVPIRQLDDIPASLLQLGQLTGHEAEAAHVAQSIREGLRAAREERRGTGLSPRVLVLLTPDTPMTVGRSAFVSELLELAGGINVGRDCAVDYYQISLEWVLTQNPDMILCLFETFGHDPCRLLEQQIGWRSLAAIRQQRVYTVPGLNTVCRPGPRVLEGLAQIKELLARDARRSVSTASSGGKNSHALF